MIFGIHLKPDDFVKRRLVTGPIWIELGGVAFPSREWVDFPVAILGFWLTNIQTLLRGQATVCECPFMDGPYQFDVQVFGQDLFRVTLVERELDQKTILLTANSDSTLLIKQILSASEIVVQTCWRNDWIDQDLLNLEARVIQRP